MQNELFASLFAGIHVRNTFFKAMGLLLGGTAVTSCSPTKELTKETTLGQSLSYIEQEISHNPNVSDLKEYGDEATKLFLGHTFNIAEKLHIGNEKISNAADVLQSTTIGDRSDALKIIEETQMQNDVQDPRELAGKVHFTKEGDPQLFINSDAAIFDKAQLQLIKSVDSSIYDTPLEALFDIGFHEWHHFTAGKMELPEAKTFTASSGSQFAYRETRGMALVGVRNGAMEIANHFSTFDEMSVFISAGLKQNEVGDFYHRWANGYNDDQLKAIMSLYFKLGYQSDDIFRLRQTGVGTFEIIEKITQHTGDPDKAFQFLVEVDRALFERRSAEDIFNLIQNMESFSSVNNDGPISTILDFARINRVKEEKMAGNL